MNRQVISFHYTLKDKAGKVIESSHQFEPVMALQGSGQLLPHLESEIVSLKKGDKKQVSLEAKDAYGDYNKNLLIKVHRDELPKSDKIKVGTQFQSDSPEAGSHVFTVTELSDSHVTMDGNHPLAGKDLVFDIEIIESREATAEELQHGHAHGPNGHGHHHH